jgi:hypothetical protein
LLTKTDFQNFIDYWQRHANEAGGIPYRSAFVLRDMPRVAPYFYLLEWHGPTTATVRLLGTALDAFIPDLHVGGDFLGVYKGEQKDFYARAMAPVCGHPCGADLLRRITLQNGRSVEVRGVGFPVRSESGPVTFQLGLTETPDPDTPLGFSDEFKRARSSILSLDYIDIGYGIPKEKPAFPPEGDYAGSPK